MRKIIIQALKGPRVAEAITNRRQLYDEVVTRDSIAQFQTERFNEVWRRALQDSPFYQFWSKRHGLPSRLSDIRALTDFPVLKKRDLVEHARLLTVPTSERFYVSGGSTGEPTKFPKGEDEAVARYVNHVITHSWLGLSPGDRYVHLWGHAHLFGQGKKAALRKRIRKTKDWIVGGYRLSAYNQSSNDIKGWIEAIHRIKPKYIVGYASALVNLATEIENTLGTLPSRSLKWLIPTAESIMPEEIELLRRVFGVPVAIEYGANESGVIAHSRPREGDRLQVLWASIAGNADAAGSLRLSTLDRRLFPLINYEIGDEMEDFDAADHVLSFNRVRGRTSEQLSLRLRDGSQGRISMVGVVGALKNQTGIRTVQAAQLVDGSAEIYVTSSHHPNPTALKSLFLRELGVTGLDVHPSAVTFKFVEEPVKSPAGKTNLLVPRISS